jgi:predicted dehydrogenase
MGQECTRRDRSVTEGIKVGVIGVGRMGRLHVTGYKRAGAQVVAVADVSATSPEMAAFDCNAAVYTDYERMLDEEELQAVSVCTPPSAHHAAAASAARRGLAVLCEKPLAQDAAVARHLADAVGAAEVPFMVGFFHRFHEPLVVLRRLVEENAFGRPIVVRSRFSLDSSDDTRPWISDVAIAGGGAMMNTAVHSLDIVRFLTGADVTVTASTVAYGGPSATVEDTALVMLDGERGDLGIVEAYGAAPFRTYELWLQGRKGEAIVGWDPPALRLRTAQDAAWREVPVTASSALDRIDRGIAYFCSCVKAWRKVQEATGADGVRAIELAESAYRMAAR